MSLGKWNKGEKLWRILRSQRTMAALMSAFGLLSGLFSRAYPPISASPASPSFSSEGEAELPPESSAAEETAGEPAPEDPGFQAAMDKLNLAYLYPEGADQSDVLNSYAGKVYRKLMTEDSRYIAEIYELAGISPLNMAKRLSIPSGRVLGKYNPTAGQNRDKPDSWFVPNFKNVNFSFYDGDGNRVNEFSNVKDIMALASVYCYQHDYRDYQSFERICNELYEKSRSYKVSIGAVYYDKGCIHRSAKEEGEEAEQDAARDAEERKKLRNATERAEGVSGAQSESGEASEYESASDSQSRPTLGSEEIISKDGQEYRVQFGETDAEGRRSIHFLPNNGGSSSAAGSESAQSGDMKSSSESGSGSGTSSAASPESTGKLNSESRSQSAAKDGGNGAESSSSSSPSSKAESSSAAKPSSSAAKTESASSGAGKSGTTENDVMVLGMGGAVRLSARGGLPKARSLLCSGEGKRGKESKVRLMAESQTQSSESTKQEEGSKQTESTRQTESAKQTESARQTESTKQEEGSKQTESTKQTESSKQTESTKQTEGSKQAESARGAESRKAPESERTSSGAKSETPATDDPNSKNYCPGHVDLYVSVTIRGFSDKNGLRSIDISADDAMEKSDRENASPAWQGWSEEEIGAAEKMIAEDWYQSYGLSISTLDPKAPLTGEEISSYLSKLPDTVSDRRKALIRTALDSVGKIPYYWGGKASCQGFEGNHFGAPVGADYRGRILRGLDCSGWVQWVYWTALGMDLNRVSSTSELVGMGTKINRSDLMPGDIIIRTGADSHVVMFLEWSKNGNMIAIHENSTGNNVSVGEVSANYPYYRRLVD